MRNMESSDEEINQSRRRQIGLKVLQGWVTHCEINAEFAKQQLIDCAAEERKFWQLEKVWWLNKAEQSRRAFRFIKTFDEETKRMR